MGHGLALAVVLDLGQGRELAELRIERGLLVASIRASFFMRSATRFDERLGSIERGANLVRNQVVKVGSGLGGKRDRDPSAFANPPPRRLLCGLKPPAVGVMICTDDDLVDLLGELQRFDATR